MKNGLYEEENIIYLDGGVNNFFVMYVLYDPGLGDDVRYFWTAVASFSKF